MNNKKVSACIFPETVPGDEVLFPLVHIFHPLVYCRAVEEDEIPEELHSSLRAQCEEAGLCRIHVPSPLGEQRLRFLALIKDLATQKDDYAARLKNLALSGIGRGAGAKRESKNSIIENLLQGQRLGGQAEEEREMLLWQARLVLKLGEIFDAEQRTLQQEMERIAHKEEGLFSELRREQANPFLLTKNIGVRAGGSDGLPKLRLKAWTRLFCLGAEDPGDLFCFVTTNQDAVDLLLEEYERGDAHRVQSLVTILLPAHGAAEGWDDRLREFSERAGELLAIFAGIIGDGDNPDHGLEQAGDFVAADGPWGRLLEEIYPQAEYGRCSLHLHRLARAKRCELFMETFGREERQARKLHDESRDIVIGRLELSTL